ncbi:hypothetical protein [Jejuia pallidilutea]|uniref:Uncharacterized protein n=2 Tax=Jejuia pallidilutea TaxID=504487 RepID=A0A090WB58_9FLAO|nr:hypothetical protein [Jejuia pallidilutea]GAL73423.1 hypothetical protein JCM19302_3205 [Jejuia pallidilutea]GAL89708.1 hypothetical protein JCM19538_1770 [Jejuia pallidilutea]
MKKITGFFAITAMVLMTFFNIDQISITNSKIDLASLITNAKANAEVCIGCVEGAATVQNGVFHEEDPIVVDGQDCVWVYGGTYTDCQGSGTYPCISTYKVTYSQTNC